MSDQHLTLDNPVFAGRLKKFENHPTTYARRPIVVTGRQRLINDFKVAQAAPAAKPPMVKPMVLISKPTASPPQVHSNTTPKLPEKLSVAKKPKMTMLLVSMATLLFTLGVGISIVGLATNHNVAAQAKRLSETASSADNAPPSETKPTNLGAYTVPSDQPRFLKIAKLNVTARVLKLGVLASGALQTPNNIYDVGWYQNSAKPADAGGAMLLDGHVHGPTQPGVFAGLKNLQPGDSIQIVGGNGKIFNFKVIKLQYYDLNKVDMAAALSPVIPGKLGLNLITCAGPFDTATDLYKQRLVVFASAT